MRTYEEPFEADLAALERNSRAASIHFYTEATLHHFFSGSFEVLDRVNPNAGFWNGVLASLQSSWVISLGRMYDQSRKDRTIHALLEHAEKHTGMFQPAALERRRIASGMPPDQAKAFAADSFALPKNGFNQIREEFETFRSLYRSRIEPIRHQVLAHAGRISPAEVASLFTDVLIRDVERLVVFPLRMYRAIWGLYMNGIRPDLDTPPTNLHEVLANIPDGFTNTWEHFHAVASAAAFITWLRNAPEPPTRIDKKTIAALVKAMELEGVGSREGD